MQKEQDVSGQKMPMGDVGSPVSNDAYNVIAALHEKLQGLEAERKFSLDGDTQVWKKVSDLDRQAVGLLIDQLEELVKDGKLRAGNGSATGQRPSARS